MKAIKLFLPVVSLLFMAALSSCNREDGGRLLLGSDDAVKRSVVSEDGPRDGQKHRSSSNFSTKGMNKGKILWTCESDDITFDVYIDKTGSDDVFATSLFNTAITDFIESDKLYIANPANAKGDFTITYEIIEENAGCVYITSAASHLDGQDHRSSQNFNLGDSNHYLVQCPDSVSFTIEQDVTGSDKVVYENVKNGSIIQNHLTSNLYISDPTGAKSAFMVTFVPYLYTGRDWMTQLSDDLYLYELSIPGTHDSGTGEYVSAGISKCQNFSIREQLLDGIRYFDIRVDEELDIRHGSTDCKIDFSDVWNDFTSYLNEHPGEVIIMQLNSHDDDDSLADPLNSYFTNSVMWTKNYIPKLGEVRGKVVLFKRIRDTSYGVNVRSVWPDDGVETNGNNGINTFYIEDRYFDTGEAIHDTAEKKKVVSEAINDACKNLDNGKMYIIFNSVAGRGTHTPWDYAWGGLGIDPEMNPSLNNIFNGVDTSYVQRPLRIGTILLDFYNKHGNDDPHHLVERIINYNFSTPFINI